MSFNKEIDFIKKNKLSTPVMFYSEALAAKPLSLIKKYLKNSDIYFAVKSCYNLPLLRFFAAQNLGAEVMTEFEYQLAKLANFQRVIVNGLGRSEAFIKTILKEDNVTFIVDTQRDLDIVKQYLSEHPQDKCSLGIRLRFNSYKKSIPQNHYLDPLNKLGNYDDSDVYHNFLSLIQSESRAFWDIIHSHFTINQVDSSVYIGMIEQIKHHLDAIEKLYGISPRCIDVGGGFEVYSEKVSEKLRCLFSELATSFRQYFPQKKLVVEPGRFLSAHAGYVIGQLIDIKKVKHKFWLITNIGTNVLIPNSNARYALLYPEPNSHGVQIGVTDGITSGTNNVIESEQISSVPQIGEYIVIGNVGAYADVYSTFWGYEPFVVCWYSKAGAIEITRSPKDIQGLYKLFFKS